MLVTLSAEIPAGFNSMDLTWTNGPEFEKENIWHLHTFISSWHSGDGGMVSDLGTVRHRPDYFMTGGCDGNDTLIPHSLSVPQKIISKNEKK